MNGDSLELKRGPWAVIAKGSSVITLLIVALGFALAIYEFDTGTRAIVAKLDAQNAQNAQDRREQMAEHLAIQRSEDRTSCVLALNANDREVFRREWRPGSFAIWCPWILDANK